MYSDWTTYRSAPFSSALSSGRAFRCVRQSQTAKRKYAVQDERIGVRATGGFKIQHAQVKTVNKTRWNQHDTLLLL